MKQGRLLHLQFMEVKKRYGLSGIALANVRPTEIVLS